MPAAGWGAGPVLMTEKDAVKYRPFADPRHWMLPVQARLDPALLPALQQAEWPQPAPSVVAAAPVAIPDIPRTVSGKIVELAVRDVIHGRRVGNADALANPDALDFFRDLPELSF
mgnify:CR=1 FL=1